MKHPIAIARELRGLSQGALAQKIDVMPLQISVWERGVRNPSRQYIIGMAAALDVDDAWLAGHPTSIPVLDHTLRTVISLPVIRTEEIDNYGTFYLVRVDTPHMTQNLPVIVGEGAVIVPKDWDAEQPLTVGAIADHDWIAPDGSPCVMLNGLPRMGWWVP